MLASTAWGRRTLRTLTLSAGVVGAPAAALACGGLFCNSTQPINQSAERILFSRDGATLNMHVRISYSGPPTEFAWLLPAPPDVETDLSSEQLFQLLDQQAAPLFQLQRQLDNNCAQPEFAPSAGGGGVDDRDNEPSPQDPGVQVLSREAIGPYDRVILQADNVGVLRAWLDENAFAIPPAVDATLTPYIEMGDVFVAIKLLPGADSGDIQPLHLKFTSDTAAIPLLPTRVAADPDMGLIVHVLDGDRAIPKNYAHVQINEAAIDWPAAGANYADVVSQAADEAAGGKAWVTDYAGTSDFLAGGLQPVPENVVEGVKTARTLGDLTAWLSFGDADMQRLVADYFEVPAGVSPAQFFNCPDCFGPVDYAQAVDGLAIAERLDKEINAPREGLLALLAKHDYLTRLYTTMSPEEMDQDPIFGTNPDLAPVDRQRTATWYVVCDDQGRELSSLSYVETPSGLRFQFDENGQVPDAIQRQAGETVRGQGVPAARIIERMFEQGQAEIITDNTKALRARYLGADKSSGCDCDATDGAPPASLGLLLLGLLAPRLRRRR